MELPILLKVQLIAMQWLYEKFLHKIIYGGPSPKYDKLKEV